MRRRVREALDDVQLVLQLYSYPGDYVAEQPTLERMAETVEKFEEDVYGSARPKGKRQATVRFGAPIDLRAAAKAGRPRVVAADLTTCLEAAIQQLMASRTRAEPVAAANRARERSRAAAIPDTSAPGTAPQSS